MNLPHKDEQLSMKQEIHLKHKINVRLIAIETNHFTFVKFTQVVVDKISKVKFH